MSGLQYILTPLLLIPADRRGACGEMTVFRLVGWRRRAGPSSSLTSAEWSPRRRNGAFSVNVLPVAMVFISIRRRRSHSPNPWGLHR